MFGTIFLLTGSLMQAYVCLRAYSVPMVRRWIPARLYLAIIFLMWLLFVAGRIWARGTAGLWAGIVEATGLTWFAFLFLASTCFGAVDVITLGGLILRRYVPFLRGLALIISLGMTGAGLIQAAGPPAITTYEIELAGLPAELDGTVLAVMSDLHLTPRTGVKKIRGIMNRMRAVEPDIILLLGDVFDGRTRPPHEFIKILGEVKAPYGSYAVLGNHDFHGGGAESSRMLHEAGFQVLRNRYATARPGLVLAGIDDLTVRRRSGMRGNPMEMLPKARPEGAAILLSHTPFDPEFAAGSGMGLILSGHTHGGQIWPFNYFVSRVHPMVEGLYRMGETTVIVTRGAGFWGPPLRLWRRGEVLKLVLRPGR